ncbi:MAG: hypothetical protein WDZ48_07050, partial [Pirellulales bacterium]
PLVQVLWAAEEKAQSLLMRLDPERRATVLMALLGLVLVGVGLAALVILAGRWALRISRTSLGPTPRYEDAWYKKPLIPPETESPDQE